VHSGGVGRLYRDGEGGGFAMKGKT